MLNEMQNGIIKDDEFSQFKDFDGFVPNTAELAIFASNITPHKRVVFCLDRCYKNEKPIHFLNISVQALNTTFNTWERVFGSNTGVTVYIGSGNVTMVHVKDLINDWIADTSMSIGDAKRLYEGIYHRLAKDLKTIKSEI